MTPLIIIVMLFKVPCTTPPQFDHLDSKYKLKLILKNISSLTDVIMIASQFIVLQAILRNSLYIQHPFNISEVFICFDMNGTRNESWPAKWGKMMPYANNNVSTLTYPIPINSTTYKLKLRKDNGATRDSKWLKLYNIPPTSVTNSTNIGVERERDHFVIWYIAFCTSLLVLQLIFTSVQLWLKNV